MKTLTITIMIASATLYSCKSTSQAVEANKTETKSDTSAKTETQETVYDVIISFTSRASGIDRDIKDKVDKLLSNFNAENENKIKPEIAPWGREGEVDYHFITKNLSTNQKKALTTKIKEAIGSSDTVFILFNKKAVHKR